MQVACSARQHLFFARTCKLSSPAPIFAFRSAAYRACTHIFAGARTRIFTRAACWRAYVLVFLLAWHVGAFEDSKRWDFETKRLTPCCVNDLLEMKRPRHRRGKVVSSHCGPPKTNSFVKNVKSSRTNCFKRWREYVLKMITQIIYQGLYILFCPVWPSNYPFVEICERGGVNNVEPIL